MAWDLDLFISKLHARELLSEQVIRELCEKVKEVLVNEGNVRHIKAPVTLVGDVHGQFYDVLEIFKIAGPCPSTNYVFLGDYVDRGYYSVETITLLTCLKLRYPDRVTLVRGNHESRAVTQTYGFYTECLRKYGSPAVWSAFTDMFDYLVLSVIVDDSIFCVHGGLSPSLHTIDQIKVIDRFREIPHEGPMADLVWSDPLPAPAGGPGDNGIGFTGEEKGDFAISSRGAGYTFGREVTRKFLDVNGLGHICRAHQLCMEGYQILYDDLLSTVWSAPNYCYRAGNLASVLEVGPGLERFFNVFGPCPDSEREFPGRESSNAPANLLGGSGILDVSGMMLGSGEGEDGGDGSGGGVSGGGVRRNRRGVLFPVATSGGGGMLGRRAVGGSDTSGGGAEDLPPVVAEYFN
ncbi:putative serine/threonine protein phosphatase [Dinochytrium kinnereticum]|nr:putative serine/threonine protein phosphatase [Dinochytrium kinnereticum]